MPIVAAEIAEVVYYTEDAVAPLTVSKPGSFGPGQALVLIIVQNATLGLADLTAPAGWLDEGNYDNTVGNSSGRVWSHVYNVADPATWNFGYNSGADISAALVRITGVDTTPVISVTSNITNLTNGSFDAPAITPGSTNDLLIRTLALVCSGIALQETDPVNMVDRGQTQVAGGFMALAVCSQQLTDGSSVSISPWTSITPGNSAGGAFSIVVKSSGALEPDPPPNPPPPFIPPWLFRSLVEAKQQPLKGDQDTPLIKEKLSGGASNANVTLTTKATTSVDDILVVFHANNFYTAAQLLTPTGTAGTWGLAATGDNGLNSAHLKIWTRKVTVGGAQTVTVAQAVDEEHSIHLLVISGADTTTWVDNAAGGNGASSTTQIAPSTQPSQPNDLLIVGALSILVGVYSIPSTFGMKILQQFDLPTFYSSVTAAEVGGNTNATGTRTFTTTVAAAYASGSILIKAPPTVSAPTSTNAPAEVVSLAVTAQDATATIALPSESSALTIAAQDVSAGIATSPEAVSFAVTGQDATTTIAATSEAASFTFSALDATVTTGASTTVNAEASTFTISAQDATTTVAPVSESVSLSVTAQDTTTNVLSSAIESTVTVAGQDASTTIAATIESALWSLVAQDSQVSLGVSAEVVSFTTSAQDATTKVAPVVENASFTFSALDATVVTGSFTNCIAEVAQIALAAQDANGKVDISAEASSIALAGQDASSSISAASQVATLTLAAQDVTSRVDVTGGLASFGLVGNDLGALVQTVVDFASIILAAQQITTQTATYGWPLIIGVPSTLRVVNVGTPSTPKIVSVGNATTVRIVNVGTPY